MVREAVIDSMGGYYRNAFKDSCVNCGVYTDVGENGFCRVCAAEVSECLICGSIYSLQGGYLDGNICKDCNPYYKYFIEYKKVFNESVDDILSFYREAESLAPADREVLRRMVKAILQKLFQVRRKIKI